MIASDEIEDWLAQWGHLLPEEAVKKLRIIGLDADGRYDEARDEIKYAD